MSENQNIVAYQVERVYDPSEYRPPRAYALLASRDEAEKLRARLTERCLPTVIDGQEDAFVVREVRIYEKATDYAPTLWKPKT